ncbi:MAG: diacylglycerol/lipid kinase family protein [Acidobacteriota bacterium]
MSRLPVIVNPVARGGRSAPDRAGLERVAAGRGARLEWWETTAPGHATELAARAVREHLPAVAVWGGDGTYNEAARGLLDSDTALLLLPGGTTSVLVYELGLPRDPEAALVAQLAGERRAMAVAHTDRGQLFLLMLSAGPDSLILQNLPSAVKLHAGKIGITYQAFVEFTRARLPRFHVECNGTRREVGWCIVGNARSYGGPYAATPGADPFSPGFEVVILTRHGRRSVVPFFFAIPFGRHLAMRGVERYPALEAALEGDEGIPYQLDGDPAGHLPVSARAGAERLTVLVPKRA